MKSIQQHTPFAFRAPWIVLIAVLAWLAPAAASADTAPARAAQRPSVEVVFVLDTTGSMSGLIAAAKEKIWSIANTLAATDPAPEIRMGLVGYRDRGDTYVTTSTQLTDDLDALYARLMQFQAGGGGDGPESVNQALHEAVTKTGWNKDRTDTYRVIFLVGDAPPHMDYDNDIRYAETCGLAGRQGIVINTIQCGGMAETTAVWKEIALKGEGAYFHVSQSGSTVSSRSPYDDKIAELSRDLDSTRLYYGSTEEVARMEKRKEESEKLYVAAAPSAIAQRSVFNTSKAGAANFLGHQELVQDVADDKVDLDTLDKNKLPEALKGKNREQIKQYVRDLEAKRRDLQKQIAELAAKRQDYLKKQARLESDTYKQSFDAKVYQCIKTQAAKKHIIYKQGPIL